MYHRLARYLVALAGLILSAAPAGAVTTGNQSRRGLLLGARELCGGPSARDLGCHVVTGRWSGCVGHVCRNLDEVAVQTLAGRTIARLEIRRGRFAARLQPGDYRVEFLWTAKHLPPEVAWTHRVTVRSGRITRVVMESYAG